MLRPPVVGITAAATFLAGAAYALVAGGSAATVAVDPVQAQPQGLAVAQVPSVPVRFARPAVPATVTVQPGATLWKISAQVCGTPRDYLALAYNNRLRSPDLIAAGQVLRVACHAAAAALRAAYPPPRPRPPTPVAVTAARSNAMAPSVAGPAGDYSCSGLEALWLAAGGNPASARTAAAVAMAESGGNPNAVSPTDDFGLWQVNGSNGSLATLSPSGNARSAVILSHDGTNWSPWTTFTSGASAGRC